MPFYICQSQSLYYAEQIDWCALLSITVFRTTATRFYAYLICLTHVPYILNYTILDFICQALFLQLTSQLQYQPQMNLDKIIE